MRNAAAVISNAASRGSVALAHARRCGHPRSPASAQSTGPADHHDMLIPFTGGRPYRAITTPAAAARPESACVRPRCNGDPRRRVVENLTDMIDGGVEQDVAPRTSLHLDTVDETKGPFVREAALVRCLRRPSDVDPRRARRQPAEPQKRQAGNEEAGTNKEAWVSTIDRLAN